MGATVDKLRRWSRRIWIRTSLIALLAVVSAVSADFLGAFVPESLAGRFSATSVTRLLEILAASMLTVTTFSLSIMISARQSASTQGTPRSHSLLLEDTTTQTVIATFLGAFVFALVSLILMSTGLYEAQSVVVVLGFTIAVVALVVLAILRWIDHLADLGGVSATADKLEKAAHQALRQRRRTPCLGARPLSPSRREIPIEARTVVATKTGYVEYVDLSALNGSARRARGQCFVTAEIGTFVAEGEIICHFTGDQKAGELAEAFSIGTARAFDHDPRYCAIVLSEIAQRALSPGVNDPGTAIDVIGRLVRVILPFRDESKIQDDPALPHVWVVPITPATLIGDALRPIARDGAEVIEVLIVLMKALAKLAASPDPAMAQAARGEAQRTLKIAEAALTLDSDRERVEALAVAVDHSAASR